MNPVLLYGSPLCERQRKRHSLRNASCDLNLMIWMYSRTETLPAGTGDLPAVPPCLFSMENHLNSCDDNGITVPD